MVCTCPRQEQSLALRFTVLPEDIIAEWTFPSSRFTKSDDDIVGTDRHSDADEKLDNEDDLKSDAATGESVEYFGYFAADGN